MNQPHPDPVYPGDELFGQNSDWILGDFLLGGGGGLWFSFFLFIISHIPTRGWDIGLWRVLLSREPLKAHKLLACLPLINLSVLLMLIFPSTEAFSCIFDGLVNLHYLGACYCHSPFCQLLSSSSQSIHICHQGHHIASHPLNFLCQRGILIAR